MTKKDLEKRVIELEELVNHQKRLIDVLYEQLENKIPINYSPPIDNETCPMGGMHEYNFHDTGGWRCKCGKTQPINPFPSTITFTNTKI